MPKTPTAPAGLAAGGRKLWRSIVTEHDLAPAQLVQLTEACRAKDRLDRLDRVLRGDVDTWMALAGDSAHMNCSLRIDAALSRANDTANLMKQLLAALRLPDPETGKRPQYRGPRGAQAPTVPSGASGNVSSMERHRKRAAGS